MDTPVADIPPVLRQAITRLLRPLVRLLIRYNISYTYFSHMLKSVYVDVAERDFPAPSGRATDSRITMLTGVHRKDVRVLRGYVPETLPVAKTVALSGQVAGTWLARTVLGVGESVRSSAYPSLVTTIVLNVALYCRCRKSRCDPKKGGRA